MRITKLHVIMALAVTILLPALVEAQCWQHPFVVTQSVIAPCNHDGQIDITVSGGTAPYTYSWRFNDPNTIVATTEDISNTSGGMYSVEIHDNNNQCGTYYIYSPQPFHIQGTSTPDNCPNHDGSIALTVQGGNIPYSFAWSNGGNTAAITNLTGGVYDVTVTDAAGCQVVASESDSTQGLFVQSVSNLQLTMNGTAANCTNNTGSATASIANGTGPYTYAWSENWGAANGSWTTATIAGLAGPKYYVATVTDANGCFASNYFYVNFTTPIQLNITTTDENCLQHNGTATAVANGSTGPYSYLWSTGATTAVINSLASGTYEVTVHDGGGCENNGSTNVQKYSPIHPNLVTTNDICQSSNGTATVTPTLGTAPYTITWSTGATTQSISNLPASCYYVTITDAAGCSAEQGNCVSAVSSITPNTTHTDQVCGGQLGSVTTSPVGGQAPYTYVWNNGATTASVTGLTAGYYWCTITDATGCTAYAAANVNLTSGFNANAYATNSEICQQHNGAAVASGTGSGLTFSYHWNTGANTATITGLSAGSYTVTITASNGCSQVKSALVNNTSPMQAYLQVTPATCIFSNDGQANVTLSGGNPPYTYSWGNGNTGATATGLEAQWGIGVYVTDAAGCWAHAYANSVGYQNLSCAAIIEGNVLDDANGNCTADAGEYGLQGTYVSCVPGAGTITNSTGNYRFYVPANNYAITQYAQFRNQICPTGSIILNGATAGNTYSNQDFFDQPLNVADLRVSITSMPPRPGFTHNFSVYIFNDGLYPVSGQAELDYDAGVTYLSGATTVNTGTHTAYIDFTNLAPGGGYTYSVLNFATPAGTALGTLQHYSAHVTPDVNDATPPNNTEDITATVVGSYDPNDKAVTPKGVGAPGYISENDSTLKYVIRFQNTGNYPTSFVAIRDTIDSDLDLATFKQGAASHAYHTQMFGNNVLAFMFDPIYLTDTLTSKESSQGFVSFYIKQKKNLPMGTEFKNTASIYFDFNDPIITNTTVNTLQTVGIHELADVINMQLAPNPTAGATTLQVTLQKTFVGELEVNDLLGRVALQQHVNLNAGQSQLTINSTEWPAGVYTVRIKNAEGSKSLLLVKQ